MILKRHGKREFQRADEGEIFTEGLVVIPSEFNRSCVHIEQLDPENLSLEEMGQFDIITCLNLLERLRNPRLCLEKLHYLLKEDGFVILSSSFLWNKHISPKNNWIGGFHLNGENVSAVVALNKMLSKKFQNYSTKKYSNGNPTKF